MYNKDIYPTILILLQRGLAGSLAVSFFEQLGQLRLREIIAV
jgi:hypothetical protein